MSHHPSSPPPIDSDEEFGDFENVFDKKQDRFAADVAEKTNNESCRGYCSGAPSFSDNDDFFGNFSNFPPSNNVENFFSNNAMYSPPPLENGGSPDFEHFADFHPSTSLHNDSKDNNSMFPENGQSSTDYKKFADFSSLTTKEENIPTDIPESSDFGKVPDSPPSNTNGLHDIECSPDFGSFTDFTAIQPKLEQYQPNNMFSVCDTEKEDDLSIKSDTEPSHHKSVKKQTRFLEDTSDSPEPDKSEEPANVCSPDVPDFTFQFNDNLPTPSPLAQGTMKSVFSWGSSEDPSEKFGEVSEEAEEFSEKSGEHKIKSEEILAKLPLKTNNVQVTQINTSVISDDDDFTDFDFAAPISSNVVTSLNGKTPYHIQNESYQWEDTSDELELKQIKQKLSFNGINESFDEVAPSTNGDVENDEFNMKDAVCDSTSFQYNIDVSSKTPSKIKSGGEFAPLSRKVIISGDSEELPELEYKHEEMHFGDLDSKIEGYSIAQENVFSDNDFAEFNSTTDNDKAFAFEDNETVEEDGERYDEGDLSSNFDRKSKIIKTDNGGMFRNFDEDSDPDKPSETNDSDIGKSNKECPFVNFDEPKEDFDPFKTGDNVSEDEFGNFGDFDNSFTNFNQPEPLEPPHLSNNFGKFDDDKEFSNFDEAANSDDEFGDFDKPSEANENDENFGKFDDGDDNNFADFDKSGSESFGTFKVKDSEDDFGDFGNSDDDFGDFDDNEDSFADFSASKPTFSSAAPSKQTILQAVKTCYAPSISDLTSCSESFQNGGILIERVHACDAEFAVACKHHTLPSYTRLVATLCLSSNETDKVGSKPLLNNDFDVFSAMNDRVSDSSAPPLIPDDLMPEETVQQSTSSDHAHILSAYNTIQSEDLSENARAIVDLIPNLDYMLSNVLMFPVNT